MLLQPITLLFSTGTLQPSVYTLICSLRQHFTDIKGSKYMLVHSLASKYARFVVLVRLMYWTPPSDHWTPPF